MRRPATPRAPRPANPDPRSYSRSGQVPSPHTPFLSLDTWTAAKQRECFLGRGKTLQVPRHGHRACAAGVSHVQALPGAPPSQSSGQETRDERVTGAHAVHNLDRIARPRRNAVVVGRKVSLRPVDYHGFGPYPPLGFPDRSRIAPTIEEFRFVE